MEYNSAPPSYETLIQGAEEKVHGQIPPPVPPAVSPVLPQTEIVHQTENPDSTAKVILNIVNSLTHFLLGAVVFISFIIANRRGQSPSYYYTYDKFTVHIYLCVTGYMILLTQSVLAFSAQGWARGLTRPQKQLAHGVMHILGSSLALAGCLSKILDDGDNSSSRGHVVTGWIVMLLTIASLVGGILNFKYYEQIKKTQYKDYYSYIFTATLVMAYISLSFAFGEYNYFRDDSSCALTTTATVFAMLGVFKFAHLRLTR